MSNHPGHDNPVHGSDHAFDARLQRRHAQSLAHVSARTQAQLQAPRQPATAAAQRAPMRAFAWPLAAACAVGMLAIGLQWRSSDTTTPARPGIPGVVADASTSVEFASTYDALDESPELYLWLASPEAATLAME